MGAGFDHVRVQSHGYGELVKSDPPPPPRPKGSSDGPTAQDAAFNPRKYMAELPRLFEYLRSELGEVRFLAIPAATFRADSSLGLLVQTHSLFCAHRRSNCCTMSTSA